MKNIDFDGQIRAVTLQKSAYSFLFIAKPYTIFFTQFYFAVCRRHVLTYTSPVAQQCCEVYLFGKNVKTENLEIINSIGQILSCNAIFFAKFYFRHNLYVMCNIVALRNFFMWQLWFQKRLAVKHENLRMVPPSQFCSVLWKQFLS